MHNVGRKNSAGKSINFLTSDVVIAARIVPVTRTGVRAALERMLGDIGLPDAIRPDNGALFTASTVAIGRSIAARDPHRRGDFGFGQPDVLTDGAGGARRAAASGLSDDVAEQVVDAVCLRVFDTTRRRGGRLLGKAAEPTYPSSSSAINSGLQPLEIVGRAAFALLCSPAATAA